MIEVQLELVHYDDSGFTNPHDVVSHQPIQDGRGTFTHLGVRMEGLESSRHWNFRHETTASGKDEGVTFYRDHSVMNRVEMVVIGPSNRMLIHELEFDTSFYTKNPSKDIYSVVIGDEKDDAEVEVVRNLTLKGDSKLRAKLSVAVPATRVRLCLGEGGLTRFRMFGTPLDPLPLPNSIVVGARVFAASDASYGDPSLVLRDRREGKVMAGWETCRHSARHRLGLILQTPAIPEKIIVDTYMHCLNAFKFVSVLVCNSTTATEEQLALALPSWTITFPDGNASLVDDSLMNTFMELHGGMNSKGPVKYSLNLRGYTGPWKLLLPMTSLKRDTIHEFDLMEKNIGPVTHMMFIGVPDGGIHRIGVYGRFA